MSFLQSTLIENDKCSLDQVSSEAKESESISMKITQSPKSECANNEQTDLSVLEDSLGKKEDIPAYDDEDDDLVLRYDDDDDLDIVGGEILNEDALLEDNTELAKVQQHKTCNSTQIQEVNLVEDDTDYVECTEPQTNIPKNKIELENQCNENLAIEQSQICVKSDMNPNENKKGGVEHGLNKPDVMLIIPSHELIEFSDEDDQELDTSPKMSPDIEDVIDLDENNIDNCVEMDEDMIEQSNENLKISSEIVTVANAEDSTIVMQQVDIHDFPKDVDVNLPENIQTNITTNALSHEAEIAAAIITNEMNYVEDEPTFVKNMEIFQDKSELINVSSESIEDEEEEEEVHDKLDEDIIELSDEEEPKQVAMKTSKIENIKEMTDLDKDILNDIDEIDNIILSNKMTKTKLKKNTVRKSEDNATKFAKSKPKIIKVHETTFGNTNTDLLQEQDISTESTRLIISPNNMQISPPEILTSQQNIVNQDFSLQSNIESSLNSNLKSAQEKLCGPNMADLIPAHSKIDDHNIISEGEPGISETSEPDQTSSIPTSSILNLESSETKTIVVTSEINALRTSNESSHESNLKLTKNSEPSTCKDILETSDKNTTKESVLKTAMKSNEGGDQQLSTPVIQPKTSDLVEPEPSTSKIEPQPEIENETSDIYTPQSPTSMTESKIADIELQASSSKTEPDTSDIIEPQPSLSDTKTKTSDIIELQPSSPKTDTKTSVITELQVSSSNTEPKTSDNIELQPSSSKTETKAPDIIEPQPSLSKTETIISDIIEPQPSLSKTETKTSDIIEPQPTLLKTETKISDIIEPQPSSSNTEPGKSDIIEPQSPLSKTETKRSKIIEPQPSSSKTKTKTSDVIEPQPSSSKMEPQTSDIFEPQPSSSITEPKTVDPKPSTSKCDSEKLDSKPNSPKIQSAFDSLVQDSSSNDVPEMTDSLGLLAECSRVMEDDEEHDDDDYGDEEDDFDPDDESSNQMTAEHSEDSNAHHSESDGQKDPETPTTEKEEMVFHITESSNKYKEPEKMECDEEKIEEATKETEKEVEDGAVDKTKSASETDAIDDETVKLSDTEDNEKNKKKEEEEKDFDKTANDFEHDSSIQTTTAVRQSIMSFVDLEESSSDEDKNQQQTDASVETSEPQANLPADTSSDVPQPTVDSGKNNNAVRSVSPNPVPEKKARFPMGLEVFTLDSDEEDSSEKQPTDSTVPIEPAPEPAKKRKRIKCINKSCNSKDVDMTYYVADARTEKFFEVDSKKRAYVCQKCVDIVEARSLEIVDRFKNFIPLFQLHSGRDPEELVEIFDSDSDEELEPVPVQLQNIGQKGAEMLEDKLEAMLNETWEKYRLDDRIVEAQKEFQKEIQKVREEKERIDAMFKECQAATDKLRNSLYLTFEPETHEKPAIIVYDTPTCSYSCLESAAPPIITQVEPPSSTSRQNKRRLSSPKDSGESPAKKNAPPTPLPAPVPPAPEVVVEQEPKAYPTTVERIDDDNTDISVVQLSVEAAPADLPPPGELTHPPVKVGMTVYAMKNAFGTWLKAKVVEITPKAHNRPFTMVRVRFEHKVTKNPFKTLPARCIAYFEPSEVRMTIGTRVIALFKDITSRQAYYSGVVAEIPNPVNNYRYLIFFDDGYAQYAPHSQTRLVCEFSSLVWEEVHPYSREFVRGYLLAYPERPMVRLHAGQNLKTEWRSKWWSSRVINVDASLVEVQFLRCDRREWIYRGSTRLAPLFLELQAAGRHRPRAMPRTQPQARVNMPYVEYTRSDEQANKQQQMRQQQIEETRRQRAVAKKSTTPAQAAPQAPSSAANLDNVTSRVVYYTPKNAVKPYKMRTHTCSPTCKRTDVLALKDLRTYNPLAKPLLSGWERQVARGRSGKVVLYVAPCGRRLRSMRELHRYLRTTDSDMPVDLFDFSVSTHCLAEFVLNKCFVGKKDLSHGKEVVPVPCVNYYDDSLPEFCSYNTERTPTAGVPLNLDPEFLCGCDCEDDCEDKAKCACWRMTLEGARTIGCEGDVGYVYRRLPEAVLSGIYECNSRCKCKQTCLNRVVQHPLQLKLQVFKTINRGWGIRALNDVPKGAFLCVYAGNLLTDATANLDGLTEGDEYLAELDYIEVVEQLKEGYEEDIPENTKSKNKPQSQKKDEEEEEEEDEESSEEETNTDKNEENDGDFEPGYIAHGVTEFSKRLRRRNSKKEEAKNEVKQQAKDTNAEDDCITISDDEEIREPSCFTAAAGMGKNPISKYRSVRTLFGEDEACYIMDAKVQGNIGRYLNHSCTPNVFVQNVFVDTHDPRFPWVAFFALNHIRAGTELTWNYNYDVGSVPGKVLYCFCGAQNCRGRLL
ncbi:kinesin-related protein 4 isoform X2 [Bicyclus anynana]|uniref:Kinesin-related protein 4 isoform X2 n=1 Tax=Bicyclus anynana TaxID=110368 RepID=A0ABM3LIP9_BICAN|nr:kinesin-related protein 4 isoform X2 [Bicyclus anynana]